MTAVVDPVDALPVTTATRMDVLDVLRGVAIFGILVYNIGALSGYELVPPAEHQRIPGAAADDAVTFLMEFLVQGKFYCLFSLLFGVLYRWRPLAPSWATPARRARRRSAGCSR